MESKKITLSYDEYPSLQELSTEVQSLIDAAVKSSEKAYAPYSGFRVGAALLSSTGDIFAANNQENVSYPAGTCAERSLLNYYHASFPDKAIHCIAVVAPQMQHPSPVTPCGFCRQVLVEMESLQSSPIAIYMHHPSGRVWHFESVKDLLPLAFDDASLRG